MKSSFLLASLLLMVWRADAQVRPQVPLSDSQTAPTVAAPLGLSILDDKGQIQGVCPLQRTEVGADISGTVARVRVTQRFFNPSKTPIEALYTFPLPHDSAVDAMNFRIGERQIVGQIKKREEAAQIYQEARAAGQNAALLDQERPNIFSQRVANIVPGQQIAVEISFVQPISYHAGRYEWEFPTVVGPRFVPSGGYTKPGERGAPATGEKVPGTDAIVTDPEKITPPIALLGQRAGHDLTMEIHLQSAVALGEISSPLHPISVEKTDDKNALISLQDGATLPNKDFVLRFAPRDGALQSGILTRSQGEGGFFQLVLQPPTAPTPSQIAPKEMVFVIDQTGSQAGLPLQKAKETMRFCIKNLNAGDTFQLLGFNTEARPCFPAPVAATPENIAVATRFLDGLVADGGTDILKAASYALKIPADPAKPRIVCFMTDGFVGNDAQILNFVRQNRGAARMFPFGVGNSVNRHLIDGMAREGRGIAEYALLSEDGEKLARRFYERIANPVLLDVAVDFAGLPVADVFPKIIPDLFDSGPVVLTGRFTRSAEGNVTLRGLAGGKSWQQVVPVAFGPQKQQSGQGLPSLWARAKIEDLSNQNTQNAPSGETADDLKTEITNVALEFRLMSQFTSFVAVEPRIVNVGGAQKTIDVPVEMPDGVSHEGIFGAVQIRHWYTGGIALPMTGQLFRARGAGGTGGSNAGGFGGATGIAGFGYNPSASVSAAPARVSSGAQTHFAIGPTFGEEDRAGNFPPTPQQLAAMKPDERIAAIRRFKMVSALPILLDKTNRSGTGNLQVAGLPEVVAGRVTVQIWLSPLADDAAKTAFAAKIKALGWQEAAVLRPGKLVLGTIEVAKLDELAALEGVKLVDVPKFGQ